MVLIIGPSHVGKTALIRLREERLLTQMKNQMERDASFIPFASITAARPNASRFDWRTYYRAILRGLQDPFVEAQKHSLLEFREDSRFCTVSRTGETVILAYRVALEKRGTEKR